MRFSIFLIQRFFFLDQRKYFLIFHSLIYKEEVHIYWQQTVNYAVILLNFIGGKTYKIQLNMFPFLIQLTQFLCMWHFHVFLCGEMIFPLPKEKNDWLSYVVIIFFHKALGISFLPTKGCGNAIPVRNEEILPWNFLINPLKYHCKK